MPLKVVLGYWKWLLRTWLLGPWHFLIRIRAARTNFALIFALAIAMAMIMSMTLRLSPCWSRGAIVATVVVIRVRRALVARLSKGFGSMVDAADFAPLSPKTLIVNHILSPLYSPPRPTTLTILHQLSLLLSRRTP